MFAALRPDSHDEIERVLALQGLERRIAMTHWGVATDLIPGTVLLLTVAQRAVESLTRYKGLLCYTTRSLAYQQGLHERHEIDPAHMELQLACVTVKATDRATLDGTSLYLSEI